MPRQLGSWAIFGDVSGQVTESPNNPVATVAMVAVATEIVAGLRRRLAGRRKWKHGGLPGFVAVRPLIVSNRLPVGVLQVHADAPEAWQRYFDQARDVLVRTRPVLKGEPPFMRGDTSLRMMLSGQGFAHLAASILARKRGADGAMPPGGVVLRLVVDSDIRDAESRRLFGQWLENWAQQSLLRDTFSIELELSVQSRPNRTSRSSCCLTT